MSKNVGMICMGCDTISFDFTVETRNSELERVVSKYFMEF